jgi:hypothetical protein
VLQLRQICEHRHRGEDHEEREVNHPCWPREAGDLLPRRHPTQKGANAEVGELLKNERANPIPASDVKFVLKLKTEGSHRAASTMATRRKGASQRTALVSPSLGSNQNTRTGPSKKPTAKTTKK